MGLGFSAIFGRIGRCFGAGLAGGTVGELVMLEAEWLGLTISGDLDSGADELANIGFGEANRAAAGLTRLGVWDGEETSEFVDSCGLGLGSGRGFEPKSDPAKSDPVLSRTGRPATGADASVGAVADRPEFALLNLNRQPSQSGLAQPSHALRSR